MQNDYRLGWLQETALQVIIVRWVTRGTGGFRFAT